MKRYSAFVCDFMSNGSYSSIGRITIDTDAICIYVHTGVVELSLLKWLLNVLDDYKLEMRIYSAEQGALIIKVF